MSVTIDYVENIKDKLDEIRKLIREIEFFLAKMEVVL